MGLSQNQAAQFQIKTPRACHHWMQQHFLMAEKWYLRRALDCAPRKPTAYPFKAAEPTPHRSNSKHCLSLPDRPSIPANYTIINVNDLSTIFPILIISPHVWANPYVSTFILRVSKLLWTTQCTRYQRWTVSRAVRPSLGGPELVMSTPNGSCAWVPWGTS